MKARKKNIRLHRRGRKWVVHYPSQKAAFEAGRVAGLMEAWQLIFRSMPPYEHRFDPRKEGRK